VTSVNLAELETAARDVLPAAAYHYFAGGAADEITLRENRAAFDRTALVPRVLRGAPGTTTTSVLGGIELATPALVAPVAYQRAAHPDGEMAMARGAASAGMAMCLSSLANVSLEHVAAAAGPGATLLFQLYPYRDRGMTEEVARRAEAAGFRALMITVDVAAHGPREREIRHAFALPEGAELPCVPVPASHVGPVTPHDVSSLMQPDLAWSDVERIMGTTFLPVVLKGVLSADDARLAAELGVAGIVVSNHGGRQLDTAPATLDVVAEIAAAAGDRLDVLLDGGVRRGTDVVKALALGARAVLVGRPVLWGLAGSGRAGAAGVLGLLRDQLEECLALAGRPRVSDVDRTAVAVRSGGWS